MVQYARRGRWVETKMDTPGIEPGAFRLQSGRATTALCALMRTTMMAHFHTHHGTIHTPIIDHPWPTIRKHIQNTKSNTNTSSRSIPHHTISYHTRTNSQIHAIAQSHNRTIARSQKLNTTENNRKQTDSPKTTDHDSAKKYTILLAYHRKQSTG